MGGQSTDDITPPPPPIVAPCQPLTPVRTPLPTLDENLQATLALLWHRYLDGFAHIGMTVDLSRLLARHKYTQPEGHLAVFGYGPEDCTRCSDDDGCRACNAWNGRQTLLHLVLGARSGER